MSEPADRMRRRIEEIFGDDPSTTADERAGLPPLDPDEHVALDDRLRTRVVGRADAVARRLAAIVEAAEADELVVETVAPTLDDRLRSYELLARAWARV